MANPERPEEELTLQQLPRMTPSGVNVEAIVRFSNLDSEDAEWASLHQEANLCRSLESVDFVRNHTNSRLKALHSLGNRWLPARKAMSGHTQRAIERSLEVPLPKLAFRCPPVIRKG